MTKPSAVRCCYSDWRLIKTRSVIQIVLEVPLSEADAAYEVMGGMPQPASEKWFAIAAIKEASAKPEPEPPHAPQPARAKRDWRDLQPSQQAGIRCQEPEFAAFLREQRRADWREVGDTIQYPVDECVRLICGVQSRKELATNHAARVIWHQLNDQYEAWMRVGA